MAFFRRVLFALPRIFGAVLLEWLTGVSASSGQVSAPLRLAKVAVMERGGVVLNQPQRLGRTNLDAKLVYRLRLVVDTAAVHHT